MDNNPNYNFGYGDTYSAATGSDHTSDPVNHYGWGSQWQQPPTQSQSVSNTYPQYSNQQQQQPPQPQAIQAQQPHLQHQHQQQLTSSVPNHYSSLGSIGSFMQQTTQKPAHQYQQKKVGVSKTPGNQMPYGGHAANPMSVIGGNEWVQPPASGSFGGRQFGQQNKVPFFGQPPKPNWKNKNKVPIPNKKFETVGKTPAMVLHELYKTVGEEYNELETVPKKFRCTLSVNGRQFQMDSPNKKAAKQKCAELVISELRPDLHLTPFEEGIAAKAVAVPTEEPVVGNGQVGKRNADAMEAQKRAVAPVKKAKLAPVESALSLLDFMQKIILESSERYTPVFDVSEAIKTEGISESEPVVVKEEVTENEKKRDWKKNDSPVTVSLKFADQGKVYSKTGSARGTLKDMVIREALRDLFGVSQEDITTVARRHANNRLGSDMTILQCLNTTCSILNCTVTQEVEPAEDRPLGEGKMFFTGKCTIIDHNDNDKKFQTKSPSFPSKALAKEYAAQEMLRTYFKIVPPLSEKDGSVSSQGPCAVLHSMLSKQSRQKSKIAYEFKDNVPAVAGQSAAVFYCDCIIDDKDRYTGSGRSKKLAKSEAAMVALKKIFHIDFDPSVSYPLALSNKTITESKVSSLCRTIAEFCKREYHQMIQYYEILPSNQIACFLLVNENLEKRLLSIGSALQCVVEPDTLNGAQGTSLLHVDPIVLARRALVRTLVDEIEVLETCPENSVFEKQPDGKATLKPNLKLILYSNYAPVCSFSVDDANPKSLSYLTPTSINAVPGDLMTTEEIRATKTIRIHTTADKIFKWNHLGVQGALLSNYLHPIIPDHIFFGSESPVPDASLQFALRDRLGEDQHPDLTVESVPVQIRVQTSYPHLWVRGAEGLEILDYNSGRTSKGSPSRVCKAEIFKAYRKLKSVDPSLVEYAKAKEAASEYQYEKKVFYAKLEAAGYGKWQTKPPSFVDQFTLSSLD